MTRNEWTRGYRHARETLARIKTLLDSGMAPDSRTDRLDHAGQVFGVDPLAYSRAVWSLAQRQSSDPLVRRCMLRQRTAIRWI